MTLRLKAATQPAVKRYICQFTPIQSMNCQIHYSRRTTMSKFHTPRRDKFSSGLALLSFYFFFFTKEGGKWLIEASKWRCIAQNEARDKKELTWTFEPQKEMTPLLCPMFFNSINSFLLLSECLYDSLFFWISSRLLLYTDLNVLWPLWPLLPTIFFLRNTYHSKNEVTMTNQQLPSGT